MVTSIDIPACLSRIYPQTEVVQGAGYMTVFEYQPERRGRIRTNLAITSMP